MTFLGKTKTLLILLLIITLQLQSQEDPGKLTFPELNYTPSQPLHKSIMKGIDLYYQENHETPVIKIDFIIPYGSANEPKGKEGLASLALPLLKKGGTRKYQPEWINERLDFLGSKINIALADEYSQISMWCLKKNFAPTWDILTDMILYPAFEEKRLDELKLSSQHFLRQRWDNPSYIAYLVLLDLIYGKNSYTTRRPTISSIQSITRDDVVSFFTTYVRNAAFKVAISGDFVPREMVSALKDLFKGWRVTTHEKLNIPVIMGAVKPGIYLIHKENMAQTAICVGHFGINRLDPDKAEINVLNYIYGQDVFYSRLGRELRANRGIVYNINGTVEKGSTQGIFRTFCMTANEAVGEAIAAMKNIMVDLTKNVIPPEELNTAINSTVNSFVHLFEDSHKIIIWKIIYKLWGYPDNYLETYLQHIKAIDQQKILSMAQRTIHPDQLIILVIGNRDLISAPLKQLNMGPITELTIEKE